MLDRLFIFLPERELISTPAEVGLEHENVFFSAPDGTRLHGWFVPGEGDVTLLWFHGNGGNVSHRVENLLLLHRRLGLSVFIFDYRGYGLSEGEPSEAGTYLDAEGALEYLRSRRSLDAGGKLVFFGRSLGCGVAVEMATRHAVRALILESPMPSIRAMVKRLYPYLPMGPLMWMVRTRYDSKAKIKRVRCPVMVLHGDRDEVVPFEMGRELFDAANEPKLFYTIEGAGHNDTYLAGGEPYYVALKRFIERPLGGEVA